MKIIKIEKCIECPYISGFLCRQVFDNEKHRCKEIPDREIIPDWCPLETNTLTPALNILQKYLLELYKRSDMECIVKGKCNNR